MSRGGDYQICPVAKRSDDLPRRRHRLLLSALVRLLVQRIPPSLLLTATATAPVCR